MNYPDLERLRGANALVIGGAGFVGSNLVHRLRELGAVRVVVLDDFSNGRKDRLPSGVHTVEASCTSLPALIKALEGIDYVFNFACVSIERAETQLRAAFEVNAYAQALIAQACRVTTGIKRIVMASTSSVYGDITRAAATEFAPTVPVCAYGVTKVAGEQFAKLSSVETTIIRYTNIYGPRQSGTRYRGVVSRFIEQAIDGGVLDVIGDGIQSRDFLYVDDAVDIALRAAVANRAPHGEVFNAGTGATVPIIELARDVCEAVGVPFRVREIGLRSVDNITRRCVDAAKAAHALGWQPRVEIGDGLRRTAQWMRADMSCGASANALRDSMARL